MPWARFHGAILLFTAITGCFGEYERPETPPPTSPQSLSLQLTWDRSGDDLDLHLLDVNGEFEGDSDCYWQNCGTNPSIDWGEEGPDDDPSLDLDDTAGTGPENLNYAMPYGPGPFTVLVHDYPGEGQPNTTEATVEIRIADELVGTVTAVFEGEDRSIAMASIDALTGEVVDLTP